MIKKIERDVKGLAEELQEPLEKLVEFIKEHQKVILLLAVGYLLYKYLFSEDDE